MGEAKLRRPAKTTGAPYPQDEAPSSFAQLVDQLSALLLLVDAELSKENHDENRVGIYMSDITSLRDDLVSQLPAAAHELGPEDHHIRLLQSIQLYRLPAIDEKLLAHKLKLEGIKEALRQRHDADMAALDAQLAEASSSTHPSTAPVDISEIQPHDEPMNPADQQILDARLETIETRMDGRVASIEASISAFLGRQDERSGRLDDRLVRMEQAASETRTDIKNLKSTIIVTAISVVLAIVLGVAAFNATVLSNMLAAFESGKNTGASQAEAKKQFEETSALIRRMQEDLDARRTPAPPASTKP